ncbi:MAG: 16S rRNA (guanine(527)-N(7))-methyltransferase RsmG [Phycisphaerae bacterium]|nr:16S rRNA (guanine(527)-N(7))-methyltransferase RsmG [Phycisphaerae bacterium]
MPEPRAPLVFTTDLPPLPTPAWLVPELTQLSIELEPADPERLGRFLAILLEANNILNLTAITDPDEAWRKHILDSLTLIPVLAEVPEGGSVADVGSGGGVPAIPLAICLPALRFTLIESTQKKAAFLRAAADALALTNIDVINDRAENLGQNWKPIPSPAPGMSESASESCGPTREAFDAVTARALGRLNIAAELTVPLAKPGGIIALVKGEKADEELLEARRALGLLGAVHVTTLQTPTSRIVILEKTTRTPRTYPREAGEPKRKPLT